MNGRTFKLSLCFNNFKQPSCPTGTVPNGFTMLELMIVITIIVILASITLPLYQNTILQANEAVLRENLFQMRKMIDQYAADKGALPQSLEDLVSAKYLKEVPRDPITGEKDWNVIIGDDVLSGKGKQGVTDVKSSSTDIASDGTQYNEW
jgi:general secretion pathway protein G